MNAYLLVLYVWATMSTIEPPAMRIEVVSVPTEQFCRRIGEQIGVAWQGQEQAVGFRCEKKAEI